MATDLIHDRGSEIVGIRLTVYNLLAHVLDPTATKANICGRVEQNKLLRAIADH